MRRAERSVSSPAAAYRSASSGSSCCSHQSAARRYSSVTRSGSRRCSSRAEHVAEELVIAIPAARVIERDEEEIRALDRLEHARRVRALEHRVAEIAAHPVEHRGAGQELHLFAR